MWKTTIQSIIAVLHNSPTERKWEWGESSRILIRGTWERQYMSAETCVCSCLYHSQIITSRVRTRIYMWFVILSGWEHPSTHRPPRRPSVNQSLSHHPRGRMDPGQESISIWSFSVVLKNQVTIFSDWFRNLYSDHYYYSFCNQFALAKLQSSWHSIVYWLFHFIGEMMKYCYDLAV